MGWSIPALGWKGDDPSVQSLAPAAGAGIGAFFGGPAGAAIGLGAGGMISSALGAKDANEKAEELSDKQMAFQERMSNTAHQREVEDLRKAGLNPILSVNSGSSSPAGAMAPVKNEMEGMSASALQMANLMYGLNKQEKEIELLEAQKNKTNMDTTVTSKDLPKSEIFNFFYDMLKNAAKGAAKYQPKMPSFTPKGRLP